MGIYHLRIRAQTLSSSQLRKKQVRAHIGPHFESIPKGLSPQCFRFLIPKTIADMVWEPETSNLAYLD